MADKLPDAHATLVHAPESEKTSFPEVVPVTPKAPLPWWGLRPAAAGASAELYWGARAIYRTDGGVYSVECLWDRQSWSDQDADEATAEANAPARKVISDWFNARGKALLTQMCKVQHIASGDDYVVNVHERGFHIIANPKKSYGYLYLAVWKDDHVPEETPAAPDDQGSPRPGQRRAARDTRKTSRGRY